MEKQIENGRDAEELFEKVLKSSNSVAVLGVCISLTLASPKNCLKAALPIVSSPAIWTMDIDRYVHDRSGRFKFPFERNDWDYTLLGKHDGKPHRQLEIRVLATCYLFFSDHSLSQYFKQAVSEFTEKLPFRYQEQKENLEITSSLYDQIKHYQLWGDRSNYQIFKKGEEEYIQFVMPEYKKNQYKEDILLAADNSKSLHMQLWSSRIIKDNYLEESEMLGEMIELAKKNQRSHDFIIQECDNSYEIERLGAVAGVVAAGLIVNFEWMKAQDLLQWSKNILMSVLCLGKSSSKFQLLCNFDISAGRGLTALILHGEADIAVRKEILILVSKSLRRSNYSSREVSKLVFFGLQSAWKIDPILCWNTLGLVLSFSVIPTQIYYGSPVGKYEKSYEELEVWEDNIIQRYLDFLSENESPELSRIPSDNQFVFNTSCLSCLASLPLTELCQEPAIKDKVIKLFDDLINRTILENLLVENKSHSQSKSYEWNRFIFNLVAHLAMILSPEEISHHILKPLQDNWTELPDLMTNLLDGYISHHIAYIEGPTEHSLNVWKKLCHWVLDSSEMSRQASSNYFNQELDELLQLIVFVQYGSSRIKNDWQFAHLFLDVFDKWVHVTSHNSYTYKYLLTMLNGIGWQFSPKQTLKWLDVYRTNANQDLWTEKYGNALSTAKLLHRIWFSFERQIRNDSESLKWYSELVYTLVTVGVPLANVLQKNLESRD